jgi:hypothetical protein
VRPLADVLALRPDRLLCVTTKAWPIGAKALLG